MRHVALALAALQIALQIAAFIQENCLKSTVFYAQRGESTASSTATSSSKQRRRRLLTAVST
jgi:hypothetical protein